MNKLGLLMMLGLFAATIGGCATSRQVSTTTIATAAPPAKVKPFLMFQGAAAGQPVAEEAMRFYMSLFDDARAIDVQKYAAGEAGPEGSIKMATFEIAGVQVMCSDSPIDHAFDFTPSSSLLVTCADEAELDRLFVALGEQGETLMPPGDYGFSRKFAFVADRYGVSWQLMLP